MSGKKITKQDACGCCEGTDVRTPLAIDNRPGLSPITYRIGTHADFLASLEARLSSADYPALARLRTRDSDDFSIALLDAYACMADVLTFYQERLANESYMRTAVERESLRELARLIGYRLRPGVAAETWLAFTMQEQPLQAESKDPKQASGVPDSVTLDIDRPVKVQSLPGPDEKPQVFETVESVELRPEWNVLLPKTSEVKSPAANDELIYLQGTSTQLKAGDALLFLGSSSDQAPSNWKFNFRYIKKLTVDSQSGYTIAELNQALDSTGLATGKTGYSKVCAMRVRASLFGNNAPDWRTMTDTVKRGILGIGPDDTIAARDWPNFTLTDIADPPTGSGLRGQYFDDKNLGNLKMQKVDSTIDFAWGTGSPDPTIGADNFSVRWTGWVQAPHSGAYTFYTRSDDGVRLWVDNIPLIDNWTDHGEFDNKGTSIDMVGGQLYSITLEYYEHTGGATIRLFWESPLIEKEIVPQDRLYPDYPATANSSSNKLRLDALYTQIAAGSLIVLSTAEHQALYQVSAVSEDARADFTLTGKTSVLTVDGPHLREYFNDHIRETVVYAVDERLAVAETPITDNVESNTNTLTVTNPVDGLQPGRKLILSGTIAAADGSSEGEASEELTLTAIESDTDSSTLTFKPKLANTYIRGSVRIYANVVRATHGETVNHMEQILGSGSGQQANQRFILKQGPLTFIQDATSEIGATASLTVRVNDIEWLEAPTLYGAGPHDRSYVLRMGEDGKGTIRFGDGKRGARLPTGQDNVRATYRKGIGKAGNLKPGQLSLLLSRPLGVKAVSNPRAAEGGADADSAADARRNMPLGVRTLGRVVSVRDYEDYARAYTGIAKAQAAVLTTDTGPVVFITVAGDGGTEVPEPTIKNLVGALRDHGDPLVHCQVLPYEKTPFHLRLHIKRDSAYEKKKVHEATEGALRKAFSFDARDFGQIVARSDVIAVVQEVDGVVGVDLDRFYTDATTDKTKPEDRLVPAAVTTSKGARILLLDDGPIDFGTPMP